MWATLDETIRGDARCPREEARNDSGAIFCSSCTLPSVAICLTSPFPELCLSDF